MAMMMRGGGDEDNDEDCFQSSCGHFVNFRFGSFFFVLHCIGIGIFFSVWPSIFFLSHFVFVRVAKGFLWIFSHYGKRKHIFEFFRLSISPLSIVVYLKGVKYMCDVNVY